MKESIAKIVQGTNKMFRSVDCPLSLSLTPSRLFNQRWKLNDQAKPFFFPSEGLFLGLPCAHDPLSFHSSIDSLS